MIASCEPFLIHLNLLSRPVMQRPMCSPVTDLPQTDRKRTPFDRNGKTPTQPRHTNTSSSGVFLSKVNDSVPGRHSFISKTAPETPLRQYAGFCLKVKLQCLRFFLRTVIRPTNESMRAVKQISRDPSFVSCTEYVPWHTLSTSKTENKCVSIFRNTLCSHFNPCTAGGGGRLSAPLRFFKNGGA